jgi:uncharacterized membrane protein
MNGKAARHGGLRDHLPLAPKREELFRWRGNEVTRVEGFTDAVFGFAVTLLVVALEVPRTFAGLMDVVRGFPAFVICFVLLMTFWNAHYKFHRRYGMEDMFTRVVTMAILVLVLFLVYPLKFLFTLVTVQLFGLAMHDAPHLESLEQVDVLYVIYGLGFAGAWGLYGVLYLHAYRARKRLGLNAAEVMLTRGSLMENAVYVGVCLLSVVLALVTNMPSLPGFIYFLIGPLMAFVGFRYGNKARSLAKARS